MEQLSLLHITRTDTIYRFRLEPPIGPVSGPLESSVELTTEQQERLRRALQSASQYMQSGDAKGQARRSGSSDALISLGRFLFDTLLSPSIQESLRQLDA